MVLTTPSRRILETALPLLLGASIALGAFNGPTFEVTGSLHPPDRPWYFHARTLADGGTLNLTMGEVLPYDLVRSGLTLRSRLEMGFSCFLCVGQEATFNLSPPYPLGFEILPGAASIDVWMVGSLTLNPCCPLEFRGPYNALLNFTLTDHAGLSIGSTVLSIAFSNWDFYTGNTLQAQNHTVAALPIPAGTSLKANEPAHLTIIWLNPDSTPERSRTLGIEVAREFNPSGLRIRANYYTSRLTLQAYRSTARIGDTIHVQGRLVSEWNGTGIPHQKVSLTAYLEGRGEIQLNETFTSETGEYFYDWSPQVAGQYRLGGFWPGTKYFTFASSDDQYVGVGRAVTKLTLGVGSWFSFTTPSMKVRGGLEGVSGPIAGADIIIAYKVPGSETWTTIASSQTDARGNYEMVWTPHATGEFSLRATWVGDARQDPGEASSSVRVPAFDLAWNVPTWLGLSGLGTAVVVFVWKRKIYQHGHSSQVEF